MLGPDVTLVASWAIYSLIPPSPDALPSLLHLKPSQAICTPIPPAPEALGALAFTPAGCAGPRRRVSCGLGMLPTPEQPSSFRPLLPAVEQPSQALGPGSL